MASDRTHAISTRTQGRLSPADLAELMGVMSESNERLKSSHDTLCTEVARLTRELGQANEQLERSRRLAALGEMAAGIAHEVRNPLASISLYARMLVEDLIDRPDERTIASKIAGAVRQGEAIVQDVLSFAREICIDPVRVDARGILSRACESAGSARWAGKIIIRRADENHREPIELICDAGLIEQALVNLIRNAVEAMLEHDGSGTLVLDARHDPCKPSGTTPSERPGVVLSVIDSGPGVAPEIIDRMFNPFFTTRPTGTGLGLAIVHRIMDAHRGQVRVGAGPGGRGAAVELYLPGGVSTARSPARDSTGDEEHIIEVRTKRTRTEQAA